MFNKFDAASLERRGRSLEDVRTHPAGEVKSCVNMSRALDGSLEHCNCKPLCQDPDLEVDVGCCWHVHVDSCDWQPHEQLLRLDSIQVADGAILELSRDVLAVKRQLWW